MAGRAVNPTQTLQVNRRATALLFALACSSAIPSTSAAQVPTYKLVHTFTGTDGADPEAGVLLYGSEIYGTTYGGGAFGVGTAFKIEMNGTESVLHSFSGYAGPEAGLIPGASGTPSGTTLYGTTLEGGADGIGTVFKMDTEGRYSVLHSFGGPEGSYPYAGLVRDPGGEFYGTTLGDISCIYGCGTVFKMDAAGNVTLLYGFRAGSDGAQPYGGLVRDAAGNLFGTTVSGGTSNCAGEGCGVVFKVDSTGNETVLYRFTGGSDGGNPLSGLIRGADGNLYGTTSSGGAFLSGTVFKLDMLGQETVLYDFTGGADGGSPFGGLIQDASGSFYGTTEFGGATSCTIFGIPGCGTVFKLDTSSRETVLYRFPGGRDGATPIAGLSQDARGNLYGTASQGGDLACGSGLGCGVVFELNP
jgi:uncharacterized repeat protein (TIGR03803 family)